MAGLELKYITKITSIIASDEILNLFIKHLQGQGGSGLFGALLLKFVLFEMYSLIRPT